MVDFHAGADALDVEPLAVVGRGRVAAVLEIGVEFRELVGAVLEEEGERDGLVALHAFAAGPARRLEDAHVRLHLGSRHLLDLHGERGRRAGRGEQRDGHALAVHVSSLSQPF